MITKILWSTIDQLLEYSLEINFLLRQLSVGKLPVLSSTHMLSWPQINILWSHYFDTWVTSCNSHAISESKHSQLLFCMHAQSWPTYSTFIHSFRYLQYLHGHVCEAKYSTIGRYCTLIAGLYSMVIIGALHYCSDRQCYCLELHMISYSTSWVLCHQMDSVHMLPFSKAQAPKGLLKLTYFTIVSLQNSFRYYTAFQQSQKWIFTCSSIIFLIAAVLLSHYSPSLWPRLPCNLLQIYPSPPLSFLPLSTVLPWVEQSRSSRITERQLCNFSCPPPAVFSHPHSCSVPPQWLETLYVHSITSHPLAENLAFLKKLAFHILEYREGDRCKKC